MKIQSTRLGELTITDDNILNFAHGLPGFSSEKSFALLPQGPNSPFSYLQSIDNPDLTFVLVNPFAFFTEYSFAISDEVSDYLAVSEKNSPLVLNIVTIKDTLDKATANLLAPVIVNPQTRIAAQIVLEKTDYTTRHLLFPNGLPQQPAEGGE